MRKLLPLLFCILLVSCDKQINKLPVANPNSQRINSRISDEIIYLNSSVMLESDPRLTNADNKEGLNFDPYGTVSHEMFNDDVILPRFDLKIIIDTSANFYSKGFDYERRRWIASIEKEKGNVIVESSPTFIKYFNDIDSLRKKTLQAHKVLIYNQGRDNAYISTGSSKFPMIQEALDANGEWKPIEFQFRDLIAECGVPYGFFYDIAPRHYAIVMTKKYHGDFKTKIRVKLKSENQIYYSNEVTGFINRSQFDQSFLRSYITERHSQEEMDLYNFETHKKLAFLDLIDEQSGNN